MFCDYKFTKYMNDYQVNPNHQFMNYKFLVEKLTGEKVSGELDILGVSKTKDVNELLNDNCVLEVGVECPQCKDVIIVDFSIHVSDILLRNIAAY